MKLDPSGYRIIFTGRDAEAKKYRNSIVRHQDTFKTVIPFKEKLNRDKKLKNLSIVVNGVKNEASFGYGCGYCYGYGYGYYETEKKKIFFRNY